MPPLHPKISSHQLRDVNDLTLLSRQPGHLDCRAYLRYLEQLGHFKEDQGKISAGIIAPAKPRNSMLQNNKGDRTDNKTDFRADQALWSQDNLPSIIYIFDKPNNWLEKHHLKDPPEKKYTIYGKRLRDVPILPDHISSKLEGWRVEAWMRFDPRVSLQDFMDRIHPAHRPTTKSVIQMRTLRFREDCNVLGWVAQGKTYEKRKEEIKKVLIDAGINPNDNTTRGISWGLKVVPLGEAGGRVMVPEARRQATTVDMSESSSKQNGSTLAIIEESVITNNNDTSSSISMSPSPSPSSSGVSIPEINEDNDEVDPCIFDFFYMGIDQNEVPNIANYDNIIPVDTIGYDWRYQNTGHLHLPHAPQYVAPDPSSPNPLPATPTQTSRPTTPTTPTTVLYHNHPLTLKTPTQRTNDALFLHQLKKRWYPSGSHGRRLQLAYLLDSEKLRHGFVDNRGFWEPVGGPANWGCIDADIIYG